jgi:hypothetical protein
MPNLLTLRAVVAMLAGYRETARDLMHELYRWGEAAHAGGLFF